MFPPPDPRSPRHHDFCHCPARRRRCFPRSLRSPDELPITRSADGLRWPAHRVARSVAIAARPGTAASLPALRIRDVPGAGEVRGKNHARRSGGSGRQGNVAGDHAGPGAPGGRGDPPLAGHTAYCRETGAGLSRTQFQRQPGLAGRSANRHSAALEVAQGSVGGAEPWLGDRHLGARSIHRAGLRGGNILERRRRA